MQSLTQSAQMFVHIKSAKGIFARKPKDTAGGNICMKAGNCQMCLHTETSGTRIFNVAVYCVHLNIHTHTHSRVLALILPVLSSSVSCCSLQHQHTHCSSCDMAVNNSHTLPLLSSFLSARYHLPCEHPLSPLQVQSVSLWWWSRK